LTPVSPLSILQNTFRTSSALFKLGILVLQFHMLWFLTAWNVWCDSCRYPLIWLCPVYKHTHVIVYQPLHTLELPACSASLQSTTIPCSWRLTSYVGTSSVQISNNCLNAISYSITLIIAAHLCYDHPLHCYFIKCCSIEKVWQYRIFAACNISLHEISTSHYWLISWYQISGQLL